MSTLTTKVAEAANYVVITGNTPAAAITDKETLVWECLNALGIFDDDISYELLMSKDCKEGDARAVFCDQMKIPVPRFRKIWGILKEGGAEEKSSELSTTNIDTLKAVVQSVKPIGQFSNKDLLVRYAENPEDSAAEDELRKRSNGNRCIAYGKDGKISATMSASLLAKAKKGMKVPSIMRTEDGEIFRVFEVGDSPEQTYDVCPVTGKMLFEGYSDELGVTWTIDHEVRQFVWLMNDQGIKIDAFTANNIQKLVKDEGFDALKMQYIKIAEVYEELKDFGELPSLRTKLHSRQVRTADPFGNRKY